MKHEKLRLFRKRGERGVYMKRNRKKGKKMQTECVWRVKVSLTFIRDEAADLFHSESPRLDEHLWRTSRLRHICEELKPH